MYECITILTKESKMNINDKEKVEELKENGYGCVESKGEKWKRLNVTVHPINQYIYIYTTK